MLCSHSKKFIYFKTKKTAGTSVEIYFERFCVPGNVWNESHGTKESITEAGIVGSRMKGQSSTDIFYNHMPAAEIREKLGAETFDAYFKFCVIRNPYDKLVSRFWWDLKRKEWLRRVLSHAPFWMVKKVFKRTLLARAGDLADDRQIYMIDNKPVMNKFIRFEHLLPDIKDVCEALDIEFTPDSLGRYKSGFRERKEHYSEYFDAETQSLVEQEFAWEISQFGYSIK